MSSSKIPGPFDYGTFIDLNEEISLLLANTTVKEEAGRKSKTLARCPDSRIVLITMKDGSRWGDHRTNSRIFVHVCCAVTSGFTHRSTALSCMPDNC